MITVKLICVGKLKEKFWVDAQNEYIKRLQKFCKFELIELNEKNQTSSVKETLDREGEDIISKMEGKTFLFDVKGQAISSENLAELIEKTAFSSSVISFVIGSSFGVGEQVKNKVDKKISFGPVTLPHNLARIVAIEQIYRSFNIINNTSYHK